MAALMGFFQNKGADSGWKAGEQDLDSLSVLPLSDQPGAIRAPGGPLQGDAGNSTRLSPEALLKQGDGGDQVQGAASGNEAEGEGVAQGTGGSDSVGKKPDPSGWGGEAPRGIGPASAGTGAKPTLQAMASGLGGG